jgi:hypothetical protein
MPAKSTSTPHTPAAHPVPAGRKGQPLDSRCCCPAAERAPRAVRPAPGLSSEAERSLARAPFSASRPSEQWFGHRDSADSTYTKARSQQPIASSLLSFFGQKRTKMPAKSTSTPRAPATQSVPAGREAVLTDSRFRSPAAKRLPRAATRTRPLERSREIPLHCFPAVPHSQPNTDSGMEPRLAREQLTQCRQAKSTSPACVTVFAS